VVEPERAVDQVAAVLRGLREHGVDELFLDGLTAVEARNLLVAAATRTTDEAGAADPVSGALERWFGPRPLGA
jgi:hypothetical protein